MPKKQSTVSLEFLHAYWKAPKNVHALTTTRGAGVSTGAFTSFNLAEHVGDTRDSVRKNRALLNRTLQLPSEPLWLQQVHGTDVVNAADANIGATADGAWTNKRDIVLAVLTADCMPIFICDKAGTKIALLHAGWRGLLTGVIESSVAALRTPGNQLMAYLGPGIGAEVYEVGLDVYEAFLKHNPAAATAFCSSREDHWLANMYLLARQRLQSLGIEDITGGEHCTYLEGDRFYSYRRDRQTGRMASLVWLT